MDLRLRLVTSQGSPYPSRLIASVLQAASSKKIIGFETRARKKGAKRGEINEIKKAQRSLTHSTPLPPEESLSPALPSLQSSSS